jgi:uncharacterized protein YhdP
MQDGDSIDTPRKQSDPPVTTLRDARPSSQSAAYSRVSGVTGRHSTASALSVWWRRWSTRCVKLFFWMVLTITVLFLGAVAATRFWLVPNADDFRPRVVEELSRLTKQRVVIGGFQAGWNGWSPELKMTTMQILDPAGRVLLELPEVETTLSWRSLIALEPRLSSLTVRSPRVIVRRTAENALTVAGIDMKLDDKSEGDPALLEWLLRQRLVQIASGELEWQDDWKRLPPVRLRDVNIRLFNDSAYHRIGMTATPAADLASPIDFRSEFSGSNLRKLSDWDGNAYVKVDYANVATIARYLPLPIEVARAEGGFQSWFEFSDGRAVAVTSDFSLRNARILLEKRPAFGNANAVSKTLNAPAATAREPLDVSAATGRLSWREAAQNAASKTSTQRWSARDVVVTTLSGDRSEPISGELKLDWNDVNVVAGELRSSSVDLGIASTIAKSAPLSLENATRLQMAAPRGQLRAVELTWKRLAEPGAVSSETSSADTFTYKLSAELRNVGATLSPKFGVSGLSGQLRASEREGSFAVNVGKADASTALDAVKAALTGAPSAPTRPADQSAAKAASKETISLLRLDFASLLESPVMFDSVKGRVIWALEDRQPSAAGVAAAAKANNPSLPTKSHWLVSIDAVEAKSADVELKVSGTWRTDDLGPGVAKLAGTLKRVDVTTVHKYLPLHLPSSTRTWVREAVVAGAAHDGIFTVTGALWHFPFTADKDGVFEVKANVSDVTLDYADQWPHAEGVEALLTFRGSGMTAQVSKAVISGVPLGPTQVKIADMDATSPLLEIRGSAAGAMSGFLNFIEKSPVNSMLERFTEGAKANGNGKLNLALGLPLKDASKPKIDGEFSFENNRVELSTDVPALDAVIGKLRFSESEARAKDITATTLGGPVTLNVMTEAGHIRAQASGSADIAKVREKYDYPFLDQLKGVANWTLDTKQPSQGGAVAASGVSSAKDGAVLRIAGTLPAQKLPFDAMMQVGATPRDASLPIAFSMQRTAFEGGRDQIEIELPGMFHAALDRGAPGVAGNRTVERGVVNLGAQKASLPARGYAVRGELSKIDADEALALLPALTGSGAKNVGGVKSDTTSTPDFVNVNIRADRVVVFSHVLSDVSLRAQPSGQRWRLALRSKEATGTVSVDSNATSGDVDAVTVRLQKFSWPSPVSEIATNAAKPVASAGSTAALPALEKARWPKLDLVADTFVSEGRELGRLEVKAQPAADEWRIDSVKLTSLDGILEANGRWRLASAKAAAQATVATSGGNTSVEVSLKWPDAGRFMQRFGLPKGVERGEGELTGSINWPGSPAQFSYATLAGKFNLSTKAGRFTEMEPGIAKLLGVLSLQSLPRRLSFNFDDVFRSGFAFDTVSADVSIASGIAKSEGFTISGPAARVEIRGSADMNAETQKLQVRVFPSLSVATAVGIGLVTANPAIGAAALLGQKIARDPIERILMSEFDVTGSWAAPDVKQTRGMGTPSADSVGSDATRGSQ